MSNIEKVKLVLADTLNLGKRVENFSANTPLLGNMPELDSMAVVSVITALEDRFKINIADDEIGADVFETLGSLAAFVDDKLRS